MSALKSRLAAGIQKLFVRAGTQIHVRGFSQVIGSVWDDEVTLTEASSVWTSGIVLPIDASKGSFDSLLVEQGKLQSDDQRLFTHGSLLFTGSDFQVQVQIGSPNGDNYTIVPEGVISYNAQGTQIYKKAYITRLTTGSLQV